MADDETETEETDPATEEHQQYLDERKELVDAARESARTFDKAVLTFGAAVFGFSIAFLKDVAPHPSRPTLPWLGAAWLLFAVGLLLILLSFLFSHRACMFEIECATKKITHPTSRTKNNKWSDFTDWCNYACIGCLFLGLLSWSVFAFENLGQEGSIPMKKVETPTETKGYVPPPPPPAKRPASETASKNPTPAEKK